MTVVDAFVSVWSDPMLAVALSGVLRCEEFDVLHDLIASVDPDAAAVWADAHAEGDEHPGDCSHDEYLARHRGLT